MKIFSGKELAASSNTESYSLQTNKSKQSESIESCVRGEATLRPKDRLSEPTTRPHSWHSTKFQNNQPDPSMMQISQGTIGSPWHQAYHSSSSTSDLSSYNHGYIRRSPDQYSSRGSMESLDHGSSAYHQCQLSAAKSTNCIDQLTHLHNKRDSAYSSFSTNSSIPEYHPTSFCKERSYSTESMHSRGNLQEGIKHADIRYIRTVYDTQRGVSEEFEVNPASIKNRNYSRSSGYNKNSVASPGRSQQIRAVSESDNIEKSPPMPPARRDSYAVTRHHDRPNSWSSLDQNRSFRMQPNSAGSQHASAFSCNSNQQLKPVFGEGQLHTVVEKSPESSPLIKHKQIYSQSPQPGQPMLPTGIYPVPTPEPHFAHAPQPIASNNGTLYPALAKESTFSSATGTSRFDNNGKSSQNTTGKLTSLYPINHLNMDQENKEGEPVRFTPYKLHFPVDSEIPTSLSITNENESNFSNNNQYIDTSNQVHKTFTVMAMESQDQGALKEHNTGMQGIPLALGGSNFMESTFQNEWMNGKNRQVPSPSIRMDSYKNQMIINTSEQYIPYYHGSASFNNNIDERQSQNASDERNKLDSPSFTKLMDDPDSSVFEEPLSPSQKKSYDFTRRRLSSSSTQGGHGSQYGKLDANKSRSSVLEKICKIEQREQENQMSQVSSGSVYGYPCAQNARGSNSRGSVNSIEEIRNKFNSQEQVLAGEHRRLSSSSSNDKITGAYPLNRSSSVYCIKSGDFQYQEVERQADKIQQCNREQYVLHAESDEDKRKAGSQTKPNKLSPWQSTSLDTVGFNRSYRNSIKDAQSKVLEATSYRRKDLEISPLQYSKPENSVKRPNSGLLRGKSSPVFPHAPKERHSVTPTDNIQNQDNHGTSNQPVRIGARRRLTAEQKKRSYSEPEKMNEVGASDNELSPQNVQKMGQHFNFVEQTVADRRRMFERNGKACSTVNLSKPELKQFQQNALADYIERKTGRRPSPQETGLLKERSQSTYFTGSMIDNQSISSASSINSLQEHNLQYRRKDQVSDSGRVSSTLPPGLTGFGDLSGFEHYPEQQETRSRSSSFAHQLRTERFRDFRSKSEYIKSVQSNDRKEATSRVEDFISTPSERNSNRSASADDLLDKSEQYPVAVHTRSRSSPAGEKKMQDFLVRQNTERNSSYVLTNPRFSARKSKDESQTEKNAFLSTVQTHFDHISLGREKHVYDPVVTQNTTQMGIPKHARTQSFTPTTGTHSHSHELRHESLPLSSKSSPSKIMQVGSTHTTDFVTAEEYLYSGKNGKFSATPVNKENCSEEWTSTGNNSTEDLSDNGSRKMSIPPQRPPPPKIKCINSVNEGDSLTNSLVPVNEQKSYPLWSSSSSEPETPSQHGKISLRISESCFHSTPPVVGQDEEDDEVFVKEQELRKSTEISVMPSSPPHFPPPSLEDALLQDKMEENHQLTSTNVNYENKYNRPKPIKQDSNDRYSQIIDEKTEQQIRKCDEPHSLTLVKDSSNTTLFNSSIPTRDSEFPLTKHSSTVHGPHPVKPTIENYFVDQLLNHSEGTLISRVQNTDTENKNTLNHINTKVMSPEDVKSQELAKEIVNKDKSLAEILDPESKMKTTMDLMEGLFSKGSNELKEKKRKTMQMLAEKKASTEGLRKEEKKDAAENVSCSAYYSVSAPKAELLMKIKTAETEIGGDEEHLDINEKKAELICSLTHKLEVLKEAKESLLADIKLNNSLGEEVETIIETLCKPNEFDKYKMFIGDLDKVVNLLLSLSGRLARVENVLSSLGEEANAEERNTWNEKKKMLSCQHEDARELKENLDRREKLVMDILVNYLTVEQFQDYQHFVKMKSALLIEHRELDDKIKLGQEQLKCLLESLPSGFHIEGIGPLPERRVSSYGNTNIPPPITSSL
ncbi:protein Shroom3 isoform X2 [Bombina bombina]|uniref:protein Shroom3 isoform X2 n=1 Tax=Bombina bombina TaxID=8345 RepID=UPI00235AC9DD|nr:protein Shroom3 isoform X2 [Bombina bombina]